jgi:hypothetical protein
MAHPLLVRLLAPLILLVAGCGGGDASGDVVATYKIAAATTLVVEASESGWGRMEQSGPGHPSPLDNYTLVTPQGRNLRVMLHKGQWIVAEYADYHAYIQRDSGPPPITIPPKARFVEDGDQKVGEWTGTAYRVTEQSCHSWSRFVVMRGPGLEVFGRVMRSNLHYGAKDRHAPPCELQAIDLIGQGVMLWIDFPETKLEKLEYRKIGLGRFRLPAKPLSRSALFALLDAGRPKPGAPTPVPTVREISPPPGR